MSFCKLSILCLADSREDSATSNNFDRDSSICQRASETTSGTSSAVVYFSFHDFISFFNLDIARLSFSTVFP
jgi:hypothetical protein